MLFIIFSLYFLNNNPYRIWFTAPASKTPLTEIPSTSKVDNKIWQQNTFPIGNGLIGANIFGEISNEALTFNELTLWEGGPSTKRPNYNGGNNFDKGKNGTTFRNIQKLFEEGKDEEAIKMSQNQLLGENEGTGQYIGFGEIHLNFDVDESQVSNYIRYLDIDQAISIVQYDYHGQTITREYFVSFPNNILVIHINTTGRKLPIMNVTFDANCKSTKTLKAHDHQIDVYGSLDDNQMIYSGSLIAQSKSAKIESIGDVTLSISDATSDVYLYITAATDYKNEHPKYRTGETVEMVRKRVSAVLDKAVQSDFVKIRQSHIDDYTNLFSRVELNISNKPSQYPINVLLDNYKKGKNEADQDRELEVLLFQYGRYSTISSSRDGGILPPNLQGI